MINLRKELSRLKRRLSLLQKNPAAIFSEIYQKNSWGDNESVSGPGSRLNRTDKIRQVLPNLLAQYQCRSILDIPCGDFNWMKMLELDLEYIGGDIVEHLIHENQQRYGDNHHRFVHLDLLKNPLPKVDIILCRDCLVHFSDKAITAALKNIKKSGSTYGLFTTFPERTRNEGIVTGEWHPVNLELAPFNFPPPLCRVDDSYDSPNYRDKMLGLWKLSSLPDL